MNFIKSLFFGGAGKYDIAGYSVSFAEAQVEEVIHRMMSLGRLHTFIHEMGHALADKVTRGGLKGNIIISSDGSGRFISREILNQLSLGLSIKEGTWKSSVILAAGPIAQTAFSVFELMAAAKLATYSRKVDHLGLGLLSLAALVPVQYAALANICYTSCYAFDSLLMNDDGDFAEIAKRDRSHLALTLSVLVSEIAVGIFIFNRELSSCSSQRSYRANCYF